MKTHQKSSEACEVHDSSAGSAVQCDLHNIFAAENIRNKRASEHDEPLMKNKTKSLNWVCLLHGEDDGLPWR